MIYSPIQVLSEKLSEHLRLAFHVMDDIVRFGPLTNESTSPLPNKLSISLVGIERETAAGIRFNNNTSSGNKFQKNAPAWHINLYIMMAALFSEKQYQQGLQILSQGLYYIQNNNNLLIDGSGINFAIEPVNLSTSELSNLWGICGGTYYPSLLFKMRTINISSNEIKKLSEPIMQKETGL